MSKQYSKIIIYPVLYLKDENGNYIRDTNGDLILIKNYDTVMPSDDYDIIVETQEQNYTINEINQGTDIWVGTWIATDPTVPSLTIAAESLGNVNYFEYVKPMISLFDCAMDGSYKLTSANAFITGASGCPTRFPSIVSKLNQLPEGKRCLFMTRYNNGPLFRDPSDAYEGIYNSPWAENEGTTVKNDWTVIATALKNAGAIPNYIAFDEEASASGFFNEPNTTNINYIINDPKVSLPWYVAQSFNYYYTYNGKYTRTFTDIYSRTFHPQTNRQYIYWDNAILSLKSAFMNEFFFEPSKQIFGSNIKLSNYSSFYMPENDYFYEANGHEVVIQLKTGDANSPTLYGSWNAPSVYGIYNTDPTRLVRTNFAATTSFPNTAWNQLLILVSNIRAIKRQSPNTPIRPWIASIDFTGDGAFTPKWISDATVSLAVSTGLYWESIRHFCLTGTEMFHYWNTSDTTSERIIANCGKLNNIMIYVNEQLGGFSLECNTNKINFLTNYIISGAKIINSNNYLWRITPKPGVTLKDVNNIVLSVDSDGGAWLTTQTNTVPTFTII